MKSPAVSLALLLIVLVFVPGAGVSAQDANPTVRTFQWDSLEGAGSYLFELKDLDDQVVIAEKLTVPLIQASLKPGRYRYRVTVFDPAGQVMKSGEWTDLKSGPPQGPVWESIDKPLWETGAEGTLTLAGRRLEPDIQAQLVLKDLTIPLKPEWKSFLQVELTVPVLEKAGNYDLVLTNPGAEPLVVPQALKVVYPQAHPESLEPVSYLRGIVPLEFTIKGSGFSPESRVFILGAKGRSEAEVRTRSPKSLGLSLFMALPEGEYRVLILNSAFQKEVEGPRFQILLPPPPPPPEPVPAEEKPVKQKAATPPEPADLAPDLTSPFVLQAGGRFVLPLGDWGQVFDPTVKAAEVSLGIYSRSQKKSAWTNWHPVAGMTLDFRFSQFNNNNHYETSELNVGNATVGPDIEILSSMGFYRFGAGIGVSGSQLILGGQSSTTVTSLMTLDFSLGSFLTDQLRLEAGISYERIMSSSPMQNLGLKFLVGVVP